MSLTKVWKSFLIITFSVIIGFSFFGCGDNSTSEEDPINKEDLYPLRNYVITPGHQEPQAFIDSTAVELVSKIKLGWNLGNTFDAHNSVENKNTSVDTIETRWVNHKTTETNINTIKNAGFNAIRIPVTWYKVMDSDFIIREDWLARVTQVVNWAENNDMYIILNTHHDENIFKFENNNVNNSLIKFERVWTQIATQFQNYNEKLIFEGLNEPRTKGSASEWNGGTAAERANLNKYYQVFVNTVRTSGGNNSKRFLMVNTYGASAWDPAVSALVLPTDTTSNRLIVSIHAYTPYDFALSTDSTKNKWSTTNSSDTSSIDSALTPAYNKFVKNEIPVIMGEFGAMNKNNDAARAAWAEYFVKQAKSKGIPCFWWDNGAFTGNGELFGIIDRTNNTIAYPQVMAGLKAGAGIQ